MVKSILIILFNLAIAAFALAIVALEYAESIIELNSVKEQVAVSCGWGNAAKDIGTYLPTPLPYKKNPSDKNNCPHQFGTSAILYTDNYKRKKNHEC